MISEPLQFWERHILEKTQMNQQEGEHQQILAVLGIVNDMDSDSDSSRRCFCYLESHTIHFHMMLNLLY